MLVGYAICVGAKVIYHPAPKIAGTSIRQYLFSIDNERAYQPMIINGKRIELYRLYGLPDKFAEAPRRPGYEIFTVVRDPISRFLSAYANRVLDPRGRDRDHNSVCDSLRLPRDPDLDTFLTHFADYQQIRVIRHHTRPQSFFLGQSLGYYDHVFKFEELGSVFAYLESRAPQPVAIPTFKTDGPKVKKQDIDRKTSDRIKEILADDYTLLGNLYQ